MKERAYAKINLALNVLSRREDGYHELETIMVPLDFYDVVEINIADEMSYSCNKRYIRFDEKNTIVKMIDLLKERYGIRENFEVHLEKSIPVKAGLAGGSADATATLRIIKRLCHLNLSDEEIRDICMKIGSDVLYTYYNKPALVKGIGEEIEEIGIRKRYYVLIVKPRNGVSTREAYETLNLDLCDHPDVQLIREKLEKGEDVAGLLGNSLEESSLRLCDDIRSVKEDMMKAGADMCLMSGSGSTVFTISENKDQIIKLYEKLKNKDYFVRFTHIL